MSALQLTVSEQKAAISGKKKKKQTLKNVLNIPSNPKVESRCPEISESENLKKTLLRLLPTARLPVEGNIKSHKDSKDHLKVEAKERRHQLILGVNDLTRNIKKKLVTAVLLASDIQPKFLIHHLNLLCNYNKIPLLHLDELRKITKNCLGFPCIALGFKKDFNDFSEAVKEIQAISENKNIGSKEENKDVALDISESSDEEKCDDSSKHKEFPFTYLYRTSNNERIFTPEKNCNSLVQRKSDDFIQLKKLNNETTFKNKSSKLGISRRIKNQKRKFIKLDKFESFETDDDDLEMPKKREKRDWVIDKIGTKQNIKYFPANLMKVSSNPDRIKKNK